MEFLVFEHSDFLRAEKYLEKSIPPPVSFVFLHIPEFAESAPQSTLVIIIIINYN